MLSNRVRLALPLGVLASALSIAACGDTGEPKRQMSVHGAARAYSERGSSPTTSRAYGDYDEDDYARSARGSDADNDDIAGHRDQDNDADSNAGGYRDSDDAVISAYGREATLAVRLAVASLVKRYYAAAAAGDGALGCSLIYPVMEKTIAPDLGRPPGPAYLRGGSCAAVMSKLFVRDRTQLKAFNSTLKVGAVRVEHGRGFALLGFGGPPERQIAVRRDGRDWKIDALLDSELP